MKSPTSLLHRHHRGFTLIELLVVIVIIAILVSLSVPVYNLVMAKANALKIKSTMQNVQVAIGHYQTEYNRYPMDPSQGGGTGDEDREAFLTDGTDGAKNPISILMARTDDSPPNMNSRKIKFVDLPDARNGLFGIVDPTAGADDAAELQLMDIWGMPYTIQFDTNYDNRIVNPDKTNNDEIIAGKASDFLTVRSLMFSNGPDKAPNTKDDIVTWR
ncbi:MAG: prepilin-type N-terminal cleavage/methylation domain-containing protein [Prosthecobacter sp.]|nr:prepilin-type N-terminal cleavage/methylation domain-containing protein [Prosthecobacter sp.]